MLHERSEGEQLQVVALLGVGRDRPAIFRVDLYLERAAILDPVAARVILAQAEQVASEALDWPCLFSA